MQTNNCTFETTITYPRNIAFPRVHVKHCWNYTQHPLACIKVMIQNKGIKLSTGNMHPYKSYVHLFTFRATLSLTAEIVQEIHTFTKVFYLFQCSLHHRADHWIHSRVMNEFFFSPSPVIKASLYPKKASKKVVIKIFESHRAVTVFKSYLADGKKAVGLFRMLHSHRFFIICLCPSRTKKTSVHRNKTVLWLFLCLPFITSPCKSSYACWRTCHPQLFVTRFSATS